MVLCWLFPGSKSSRAFIWHEAGVQEAQRRKGTEVLHLAELAPGLWLDCGCSHGWEWAAPELWDVPSAVTVGKVHPSWVGAPEISLPEGGNLLPYCECPEQSAGSHMEPPCPSMVPQGAAVTPAPEPWPGRAGICFPGKHTGAGTWDWDSCLPALWGGVGQTGNRNKEDGAM